MIKFIRYSIVGGITTLEGWALVYIFTEYLFHTHYIISSMIATPIVWISAFLLNNFWTWKIQLTNKVFVVGYYGYGSTGDDAMLLGLLPMLRYYDVEHSRKGISAGDFIKQVLKADIVVLGGGTHLRNWGRGSFLQSMRIILFACFVRLIGKRFCMVNVGIDGKGWEWLARKVSDTVTIRDKDSFDSSILLNHNLIPKKEILGISLVPVYKLYYGNSTMDKKMVVLLCCSISKWLKNHPRWIARFISFNGVDGDDDLSRFAASLIPDAEFIPWQDDVQSTINAVGECGAFIGMRYHSCMFAYMMNVPLQIIRSYPSCANFAYHIGIPPVQLDNINLVDLPDKFVLGNLPQERARKLALDGIRL